MEKKPIPEVGKTYKCFDDGKIIPSRMYEVLITRVIPMKDASDSMWDFWNMSSTRSNWLFKETDYLIESISYEQDFPKICFFARTTSGSWFGLGECKNGDSSMFVSNMWCSGVLDVDGELYNKMLEIQKDK